MPEASAPVTDIETLDRDYFDPRGVLIHVVGWCREKQQIYFSRPGYPHECMQPVWKFQQYFRRVPE